MAKRKHDGDEIVLEDEKDDPIRRVEAFLDEAEELLDETETVADNEVPKEVRDTFRADLGTAAAAVHSAHAKVKAAMKARKG